jgi:cytochrome c oxidase subunit III
MSTAQEAFDPGLDARAVRRTSSSVMAMVLFILSESMFFMAFFGIYASSSASQHAWPPLDVPLPALGLPTAAIVVLVVSALTMGLALRSVRRRSAAGIMKWLLATLVLGVVFVVLQVVGYQDVGFGVHEGIYASLFYVMTAVGLAHVVGGVVFLTMVSMQGAAGELALRRDPVEAASIYWFFVVVLAIVLYVAFYLGVTP